MKQSSRYQRELLDDAYGDTKALLYQAANYYAARYRVPFEDLLSEAHLIFAKEAARYDSTKGASFSSWLYAKVRWGIVTYMRGEYPHLRLPSLEDEEVPEVGVIENTFAADLKSEVSKDARFVVRTLLNAPKEYSRLCRFNEVESKAAVLDVMEYYLSELGWSFDRIEDTFDELRRFVAGESKSNTEEFLMREVGLTPGRVRSMVAKSEQRLAIIGE